VVDQSDEQGHWSHHEMPPSGFLSALKTRVQEAGGALLPDSSAIFVHAVQQRRRPALYKRGADFKLLRGNTSDWHVCQDVHNLPHSTRLPQHIVKNMCVAGYGHVLALHNSVIACSDQDWFDLEVLPEETPKLRT